MTHLGTSNISGAILISTLGNKPQWTKAIGGPDILFWEDDFIYPNTGTQVVWPWDVTNSGTGSVAHITSALTTNPGIFRLGTGTTTTGQARLLKSQQGNGGTENLVIGGGYLEFWFIANISALATVSDDYSMYFGLGEALATGPTPGNNFISFRYLRGTSTNWQGVTSSGGTSTVASGGTNVAVATGWYTFKITVNAAANSVSFFVSPTGSGSAPILIGTSTTNIPTGANLGVGFGITKTAGTTNVNWDIDYVSMFNQLTVSRF